MPTTYRRVRALVLFPGKAARHYSRRTEEAYIRWIRRQVGGGGERERNGPFSIGHGIKPRNGKRELSGQLGLMVGGYSQPGANMPRRICLIRR